MNSYQKLKKEKEDIEKKYHSLLKDMFIVLGNKPEDTEHINKLKFHFTMLQVEHEILQDMEMKMWYGTPIQGIQRITPEQLKSFNEL